MKYNNELFIKPVSFHVNYIEYYKPKVTIFDNIYIPTTSVNVKSLIQL